jgi:hypothetical protein
MVEPFVAREFVSFARKKWAAWNEEIDARITSKDEMSQRLQKKFGWSTREANDQIDKAIMEWKRK